jgi:ribosomal protein L11 methyltransferase
MFELVLRAPVALVEPVSDALMDELDALSVSVEDADADTDAERALFGEPGMPAPAAGWERSTLKALFDTEPQADAAAAALLAQDWTEGLAVQSLQAAPEADWVRLTQSQFEPVAITPTFWIVPTWHEVPAAARQVIRLDPGLAFGTGTHPTTRLCLRWLAQGAGGADLSRMGAQAIDAVDIDPAAVQSTRDNAAANGVALRSGLPDLVDPPQAGYGLVLANILATPLKLLAPLMAGHLAPGAHLVLSGLLERQAEEIAAAYAPWLALQVADREDGWILMTGRRAAAAA